MWWEIIGAIVGFWLGGMPGAFIGFGSAAILRGLLEEVLSDSVICPFCNKEFSVKGPGEYICPNCSAHISAFPCRQCGAMVSFSPVGEWFCPACGARLTGSYYSEGPTYHPLNREEKEFMSYIAILAAKMAKADGRVSEEEVDVFRNFLKEAGIPREDREFLGNVFNKARGDSTPADVYAEQLYRLVNGNRDILFLVFTLLVDIAICDGVFKDTEEAFLRKVGIALGLHHLDIENIINGCKAYAKRQTSLEDCYAILGCTPDMSTQEIKRKYRELVHQLHPDKLIGKGVPQAVIDLANEKLAKINEAYNRIMQERGER